MKGKEIYKKITVDFIIAALTLLFLIFVVPKAIGFFLPFVIGWIIAVAANPLVRFLEKKVKIVRKHSSALIIVAAIAAVVCLGYFGLSYLGKQIISLIKDLPNLYESFQGQIESTQKNLEVVYTLMPADVRTFMDHVGDNLMTYLGNAISNTSKFTVGDAGVLVKNVAEGFLMSIMTILSAYFFISEREKLLKGIKELLPVSLLERVTMIKNNFTKAIGGYFKAQFKIMLIIIVILFAGFEIINVSYSFLLALGVALLDFLPFFGTGTVIFPWAVIELLSGDYFRAAGLIIIYLICQVVRQILQPKMVGDSIGLSPLSTLLFMFVGYRIKGILGMILGIPIGMAAINLYKAGLFDKLIQGFKIVIHDINEYRKY
ncbi:MAG: sporulation integral membrane protein YtvI [Acetivibrio sp.]